MIRSRVHVNIRCQNHGKCWCSCLSSQMGPGPRVGGDLPRAPLRGLVARTVFQTPWKPPRPRRVFGT